MARKSPLQIVKDKYGSKEELINKLTGLIEAGEDESEDDLKARLKHVANAKLLHLVEVGEKVKELGGREKLVAKVAELKGKTKDKDYAKRLGSYSLSKLLDMQRSLSRKSKKAS
jgi:hypothetical protein